MKLPCELIRDLLPLYAEHLTSPETGQLIEEHLQSCPACRDELLIDEDAAFTIHQCLHRLEEPYKEVFTLRVFGELSYEKIGAIFGHTANWACVTYCRAKRKIQQMLKEA